MYTVVLYLHIFSAILSIGPFFVLLPLVKRMDGAEELVLSSQIATFRSAVRLVKHAGHVLVATGALLIWQSSWAWTDSWIALTLAVMAGSIFFLARAFKPVLRKFEEPGADRGVLLRELNRSIWLYVLLLGLMLWLMVAKPAFW
ncbi:hypothetical protein HNQ44_002763 [Planomicrobium koreense]|uniref:DUF2269 domain-containing protein n=1 Tax=Planococcus koreensis TaxID=112331 RepID=A0A7W8FTQ6_9BACL|nr:hypothetical protein [Planococcus koreensis]MBB5181298.1 hypothetical protein [Planococcus koreensis]